MSQRSLRGSLFLGVRVVCIVLLVGFTYHDYLRGSYVSVLGDLGFYLVVACLVVACLNFSMWQGKKLADRNISSNPDRDEARERVNRSSPEVKE
jgi:hypothetical protein